MLRAPTAIQLREDAPECISDVLALGTTAFIKVVIMFLGRKGQRLSCEGKSARTRRVS